MENMVWLGPINGAIVFFVKLSTVYLPFQSLVNEAYKILHFLLINI